MQDSIFTKIIRGEVPCHKIYEDADTFAFLSIQPVHPGHVLVVPKQQVQFIWDLSPEIYQAVMATTQKVGRHIREVLRPNYVGVHVAGAEVPHAHVWVFPFAGDGDFWDRPPAMGTVPDAELATMAARLRMEDDL
ncbi:MAG TPA: HIT family protein [Candidatus Saccharimonadales bacterium]|nr:HIT family protein [Candidatus Saccharimonadales bacterium]